MAVDTDEKRRAVASVGVGFLMGPGVTSNASQDVEWRQQVGYSYSGIVPQSEIAVSEIRVLNWLCLKLGL